MHTNGILLPEITPEDRVMQFQAHGHSLHHVRVKMGILGEHTIADQGESSYSEGGIPRFQLTALSNYFGVWVRSYELRSEIDACYGLKRAGEVRF